MSCHEAPAGLATANPLAAVVGDLTIALAGNPNAGKTTVFNALTGMRQHVGNWPGKTVALKAGVCQHNQLTINVVDLPGTYSLAAYSPEEVIARDFIVEAHPEVVINVVDATNLERNLYLTVQLLELGAPVVLALNMTDELRRQGTTIDLAALSSALGHITVVQTAANHGDGLRQLLDETVRVARPAGGGAAAEPSGALAPAAFQVDYGQAVEQQLQCLTARMAESSFDTGGYPARWLATKLLEGETNILTWAERRPGHEPILAQARSSAAHLRSVCGDEPDLLLADRRYGYINGLVRQALKRRVSNRLTWTQHVDDIVTHRWLGLPIFFGVMYLVFHLVMNVSAPYLHWMDGVINGPIAHWLGALLAAVSAPGWLRSLAINGVLPGVGGVLVFVPGLVVLYFFLSMMEDSGYLARAAFVMDRPMRVVGLHGKSFIPMILGFGCGVPAIYATRTITSRRDRTLTALLVPLMSCSARLPVYVVFGLAFFGQQASLVIWTMYAVGIVVAMLAGLAFSRSLLKPDATSAFILELPPYRWPALKGVLINMWDNTMGFVHKASTTILAVSILLWVLLNLPWGVVKPQDSYFGRVSAFIAPVFAPLGFGQWQTAGALISGFVAKEVVVSTLSQVYVGDRADVTV
ncbi:MAG: ferrous iron transport protein B, partial [Anaerolineales bacterium]